nr:DNA cytosine methyltransferase [Immundisolibacter cernigliae]
MASAFEHAATEARCLELGKSDEASIDREIRAALKGQETWVLIGGPPCQAYSLAGRSRRTNDKDFHKDEKHLLYREYLRIIHVHKPTLFVMENVKGLLSSKHSGDPMFEKIIGDLSMPTEGLEYEIRSFTKKGDGSALVPTDYLIQSERHGIPQSRHRVILLGVRKALHMPQHQLLAPVARAVTVRQAIDDLPRIRSKLSRGDSVEAWRKAVQAAPSYVKGWRAESESVVIETMRAFAAAATSTTTGSAFILRRYRGPKRRTELQRWVHDRSVGGVCQHEGRAHMESDLARYLFSASFAHLWGYCPRLDVFPPKLLPDHLNVRFAGDFDAIPFKDRFRVQCRDEPSTTVVAHIAKDGHYYIHYDASQCRSLTVREAARLQTFPDNYVFAGTRTEQYTQVGNAVPPLLAHKLAKIVRSLLNEMSRGTRRQAGDAVQKMPAGSVPRNLPEQFPVLAEAG